MKKQTLFGRLTRVPAATGKTVMTLFCSLLSASGFAQTYNMTNNGVSIDQKNYSVERVDNAGADEYIFGGTLYDVPAGNTYRHFYRTDYKGNVMASKAYSNHTDYRDERVMDIVSKSYKENFIISLIRPTGTYTPFLDGINIMEVDEDGQLVGGFDYNVHANTAINNVRYGELYPQDAVYLNDYIYICGFFTDNINAAGGITVYPFTTFDPMFINQKMAFILKFDINNPSNSTMKLYDTQHNPAPTGTINDYDMALRIKVDQNGDLAVTGSCNGAIDHQVGTGGDFYSATLVLVVDANLNTVARRGILMLPGSNPNHGVPDEYGIDLQYVPGTPPGQDAVFVLSNYFTPVDYPSMNTMGLVAPWGMAITAMRDYYVLVNEGYLYPNKLDRMEVVHDWDGYWGLQLFPSISNNFGSANLVVAGMQAGLPGGCWPKPDHNDPYGGNINPFIAHFTANMDFGDPGPYPDDMSTLSSLQNWEVHFSKNNTYTSAGVSYENLGGCLDMNAWHPQFAAQITGTTNDGYMFSAPVADNTINYLNLKMIRADQDGKDNCGSQDCNPQIDFSKCLKYFSDEANNQIIESVYSVTPIIVAATSDVMEDSDTPMPAGIDCNIFTDAHKTNAVQDMQQRANENTYIFPNPATHEIQLKLAGKTPGDAAVKMQLVNITGQSISMLYDGPASGAEKKYTLPSLADGIYLVHVYVNGVIACQQKLTIKN